ncbi:hypothetical protein R1sor_008774 [Riccia sorocarpa]|uniref:Uncharacterized protein n=1 Tax=Riccia sorocarpa TaxID=122646 RepID=A0ABD3HUQ7_9MARC
MVNYTNRVMVALESCMGHEITWPDRQERTQTAVHFASLGFSGCCVIYFFTGMLGSCQDVTCLRRSFLWRRLNLAELFDFGQYLLGDSADHPIELERNDEFRPPPHGVREHNRRGIQQRHEVQDLCLEINRMQGGLLLSTTKQPVDNIGDDGHKAVWQTAFMVWYCADRPFL